MQGTVRHIHIGPSHGGPLQSVDEVQAVADQGLEGDRNYGSLRNVTIVCDGELDAAAAELGIPEIPPGSTRRNITVSIDELPRNHGTEIQLGEVIVAVWRDSTPCEVMNESVGSGAREALRGRAGVSATVRRGGTIRVGDPIVVTAG